LLEGNELDPLSEVEMDALLRLRIKRDVFACARGDLPTDETAGIYYDERAEQAGIIRADLPADDRAVYDEMRAGYVALCRWGRDRLNDDRAWGPPPFLPLVQRPHVRAPRRSARPRERHAVRRGGTARAAARLGGDSGDKPRSTSDDESEPPPLKTRGRR
jgi:hypothetical protein